MSDKPYYQEENPTIHLRVWALGQMIWGAFLAGAVLLGVVAVVMVIWVIGLLLPAESRETPDPMPRSSLEQPLAPLGHDLV